MARRSEARKRLERLASADLTPAHRLIDMVYLAHAGSDQRVTIKQRTLEALSGYGRRHIQELTRDLVFHGFLNRINLPGITPTYRIEDGHPRSQPDGSPGTPVDYTQDDVFLLQIHHAEVMGHEAPRVPAEDKLLARVLDALGRFGPEGCRGAHHGHQEQCSSWEGGKRFDTFSYCYPKRGEPALDTQWFQETSERGLPLLRKQERASKREEEAPECKQPTDEDRERGRKYTKEIIRDLARRKGCSVSAGGSSGAGTGKSPPGGAQSAKDGPVALADAVTAGLRSKTNERKGE